VYRGTDSGINRRVQGNSSVCTKCVSYIGFVQIGCVVVICSGYIFCRLIVRQSC
jgi:hypothetical protein